MEHYEVRDAMRRVLGPALQIESDLFKGDAAYASAVFSKFLDVSDPIAVGAILSNASNQPSLYTIVSILIDKRMKIADSGAYKHLGEV